MQERQTGLPSLDSTTTQIAVMIRSISLRWDNQIETLSKSSHGTGKTE